MSGDNKRVGVIGYGQIGASLCETAVQEQDAGFSVVTVFDTQPETQDRVPQDLLSASLPEMLDKGLDLVVEAAHPDAVREFAPMVLKVSDLLIMSVSALGDPELEVAIRGTCLEHGKALYIPHGATLGLDGLRDGLPIWEDVCITMRKNPRNLNFAAVPHLKPADDAGEVILYDGHTRGILPLFPKNVNSHATLALATLGMDKTRSVLVSDPELDESVIEIDAKGGGTSIHIERRNPIKGVTGKLTILSVLQSIKNVFGYNDVIRSC